MACSLHPSSRTGYIPLLPMCRESRSRRREEVVVCRHDSCSGLSCESLKHEKVERGLMLVKDGDAL
jgi:hypothetical protein